MRYILGHFGSTLTRDRLTEDLWEERDCGYETPCWICRLAPSAAPGYTRVMFGGRLQGTHRVMYEQEVGPIPEGLVLDHLCRQPPCINPSHLEPVTNAENLHRGRIAQLAGELVETHVDLIRSSPLSTPRIAYLYSVPIETIEKVRAA